MPTIDQTVPPVAGVPDEENVNYFDSPMAARRYAAHRPRSHPRVLSLLKQSIQEYLPVGRAADIGCGTGHSTVALLPYAQSVLGIDPSAEMLAQAERHPGIEYRRGYAEALPVRTAEFDLVTVSSAYHWFDQERFVAEAARVLAPGGWLVLYKSGSIGRLAGQPEFGRWRREILKARYPKVERHGERLTLDLSAQFGFAEVASETISHVGRQTCAEYVENLLTHSSVIRVIERVGEPLVEVRNWLLAEVAPFFPGGVAEFTYEAWIQVFRRTE